MFVRYGGRYCHRRDDHRVQPRLLAGEEKDEKQIQRSDPCDHDRNSSTGRISLSSLYHPSHPTTLQQGYGPLDQLPTEVKLDTSTRRTTTPNRAIIKNPD